MACFSHTWIKNAEAILYWDRDLQRSSNEQFIGSTNKAPFIERVDEFLIVNDRPMCLFCQRLQAAFAAARLFESDVEEEEEFDCFVRVAPVIKQVASRRRLRERLI